MKKNLAIVLCFLLALLLVGCGKAVSGSEIFTFSEPTTQITGSFYSQGQETPFQIDTEDYSSIIKWFYDLKATACDKPEEVEGAESYAFYVNGDNAFTYEDRGSESYIIIDGNYYKVSNPSILPIAKFQFDVLILQNL